jgi:hypothetical protein
VRGSQTRGYSAGDFVADADELAEGRTGAGDAAAFRVDHGNVVVVRRFRVNELAGEVTGELVDFAGVAVVESEDIKAEDKDWLSKHLGEMNAAVAEDQRFPRARDAVNDAVTAAEVAGELFLFEIEHPND